MKTGDTIQDAQGVSWQLGQVLGRGLWGKVYAVRREGDDGGWNGGASPLDHVLKVPLGPDDFRGEIPAAEAVYAACREAVLEQARLYADGRYPFLPRLEARLTLPDGAPGYIIPRLPDTLERRMTEGLPTANLLDLTYAALRLIRQLPDGFHGDLRPTNVLLNDRGEVFLTDIATPAVRRALRLLLAASPALSWGWPPEYTDGVPPWGPVADTWGAAMILWRGAMAGAPAPNPPRAGLDKAAQVALRDRLQDRLKVEDANPRFHARVAERYAVLLSRGLSRESTPSPPFRFPAVDELLGRMDEVAGLIRPQVQTVGKVMLDRPATRPNFDTDEVVAFSCTVGCTLGVEGPEEIGVGIAVFDIDKDVRLKDLDLAYTVDKHPGSGPSGGRYRFGFRITGMGPGRFRVRLAFAIRDSGQPPVTTEAEFNVLPAPGWVPRPEAPALAPLPFAREPESPTQPGTADMLLSAANPPSAAAPGPRAAPPPRMPQTVPEPAVRSAPLPRVTATEPVLRSGPPPLATPGPARPLSPSADHVRAPAPLEPTRAQARAGAPIASPASPVPASPTPVSFSPSAPPAPSVRPAPQAVALSFPPAPSSAAPSALRIAPASPAVPAHTRAEPQEPATGVGRPLPPRPLPPPEPADPPTTPASSAVPPSVLAPSASTASAWFDMEPSTTGRAPAVEDAPEPVITRRGAWTDEALPMGSPRARPAEVEPEDDLSPEDPSPGLWTRLLDQLRNDPYIAVMSGLGALTLLLLVVFLLIRE